MGETDIHRLWMIRIYDLLAYRYRGQRVSYPQPREKDCTVPYDDVFFAGEPPDDDREGSR